LFSPDVRKREEQEAIKKERSGDRRRAYLKV